MYLTCWFVSSLKTLDMTKEKESALMGIFLEDTRRAEQLAKEQQEADRKEAYEERKRHFHDREIPDWEKWLLKYIPLQPGETMMNKLIGASLASATGLSGLLVGISGLTQWVAASLDRFTWTFVLPCPLVDNIFQIISMNSWLLVISTIQWLSFAASHMFVLGVPLFLFWVYWGILVYNGLNWFT